MHEQKSYSGKACDSELIIQISQGDAEAFKNLFMKYYSPLVNFSYSYLNSVHIAEEVVQEVFADFWEKKEQLDPSKNIKTYLFQSAKFQSLDILKHKKVINKYQKELMEIRKEQLPPDKESCIADDEFINVVQNAIEELPCRAKQVYVLHRKEGLTYREISDVMDISIKTVESQMSRALKILRKQLDKFVSLLVTAPFIYNLLLV